MDIALIIFAIVAGIIGIVGSILPGLPGPPISWVGLLFMYWAREDEVSITSLVITGIIMLVISVLDYFAPVWFTNLGGGSKAARNGTIIGLVAGLFIFPPWGLIFGPFAGALIGELLHKSRTDKAIVVALYSFMSFLFTTGLKLIYTLVIFCYIVWAVF